MFNGGMSLVRFLAQRKPEPGAARPTMGQPEGTSYLVGGQKALYELRAACEAFLAEIDSEYFSTEPEEAPEPMPYLEQQQEPLLLTEAIH